MEAGHRLILSNLRNIISIILLTLLQVAAPSFSGEPPGDQIKREPGKIADIKLDVRNLARRMTALYVKEHGG